jgi:hypothetical protein
MTSATNLKKRLILAEEVQGARDKVQGTRNKVQSIPPWLKE